MVKLEWKDKEEVPKDKSWVLLQMEKWGDSVSIEVGRWNPKDFPTGSYEWEVLELNESINVNHEWDELVDSIKSEWWADGRVIGWYPFPPKDVVI